MLDPYISFLQQLKSGLRQNFINKLLNHLKTYYEQKDIITTSKILENWQYFHATPSLLLLCVLLCVVVYFCVPSKLKVKCDFIFIFSHSPTQNQQQQQHHRATNDIFFATTN